MLAVDLVRTAARKCYTSLRKYLRVTLVSNHSDGVLRDFIFFQLERVLTSLSNLASNLDTGSEKSLVFIILIYFGVVH